MITIKWSYKRARSRLGQLLEWATPAEAFVLTVFFIEKILRRTLVQMVILSGNSPKDAFDKVQSLRGLHSVRDNWKKHDVNGKKLEDVIGKENWEMIKVAAKLRNELVHGSGHQAQKVYKKQLPKLLAVVDDIMKSFSAEYKYSGWKGIRDSAGNKI